MKYFLTSIHLILISSCLLFTEPPAISSITYSPFFDSVYYAFPKDNSEKTFGYDQGSVCKIRKYANQQYAKLEGAFDLFQQTALTRLDALDIDNRDGSNEVTACLNYKGNSYLFYIRGGNGNDIDQNKTAQIMRGNLLRTFTFPIRMDRLSYDHYRSRLYVFADNALYRMNMTLLDSFWTDPLFSQQQLIRKERNVTMWKFFLLPPIRRFGGGDGDVGHQITDLIVFNDTLYYFTTAGSLWKEYIGSPTTTRAIMIATDSDNKNNKFNIIPFVFIFSQQFESPSDDGIMATLTSNSPSHIRISGLPNAGNALFFPLPSASVIQGRSGGGGTDRLSERNNGIQWIILLYVLDAIFVFLLVCIFRTISHHSTPPRTTMIPEKVVKF